LETDKLVERCLENDVLAQKALFERYAAKMMALCRRYAKNNEEAEDFLQEGFIRMFKYLESYTGKGSFEGWMRRIFVNTAIRHYHRQKKHHQNLEVEYAFKEKAPADAISQLSEKEMLLLIDSLPCGYRIVFNMYAIEGYSHKEISTALEIQESTSRSQLAKARKWLQNKIQQHLKVVS
jgi:RNA polymerase sigma-70 factor (ECF subfamily)